MSFLSLPNEILLQIAKDLIPYLQLNPSLGSEPDQTRQEPPKIPNDLNSLCKTNRRLNYLLTGLLCSLMIHHKDHILVWAAKRGSESPLKIALENGASVEFIEEGQRALHWAATGGYESIVEMLLTAGADINVPGLRGLTALHMAVEGDHDGTIRLLVEKGADVNIHGLKGMNLLQWAADKGHDSRVKLLLEKGADVDALSLSTTERPHRKTALYCASLRGYEAIVKTLLEKGANISLGEPRNALDVAVMSGHELIVRLLLASCADSATSALARAACSGDHAMMSILFEHGANLKDSCRSSGQNPLHIAVREGHIDAVQWLLNKVPDITLQDSAGMVALDIAVSRGHDIIVGLLLRNYASIVCDPRPDLSKYLHQAASKGYGTIVAMLLENGIDINSKDGRGQTALHFAAEAGHQPIVNLLLGNGADVNAANNTGRTPLHFAVNDQHIVEILLEKGAFVDAVCVEGRTPFHDAAIHGNQNSIKLLLKSGADASHRNSCGKSALHSAIWCPDSASLKKLLDIPGVDVNAVDDDGATILHEALLLYDNCCFQSSQGSEWEKTENTYYSQLEANVRLCLEKGIDVNIKDNTGDTVYDRAMCMGLDSIGSHLLRARSGIMV